MNTLNSQFSKSRTACHLQIGIDYARIIIASRAAANVLSSVQPDPFNQRSLSSISLSTSQQYHAALPNNEIPVTEMLVDYNKSTQLGRIFSRMRNARDFLACYCAGRNWRTSFWISCERTQRDRREATNWYIRTVRRQLE
ncbi:Hypothetical_protein [Hexamita inflata]|uniref:Hypothetical_protein n=1 Tax=Hexamita inflata TaxID=28002 RepID=A0AA86RGZ3_9EUKA|nr:Hypothetical protein HINF_LOCUS61691 [Hexamita inflata]CAI9974049.1 Hypothetical protein HINF_LOCUS61694 [Hexamita inflata]